MLRRPMRIALMSTKPCFDHVGSSGTTYVFEKLIQRRPETGSVWTARAGSSSYILKDIPESYYMNFVEDIWPRLDSIKHSNIRIPCDTVPEKRILVYKYLSHDFFELARMEIGFSNKKRILKSVLEGLAAMHDQDIAHLDIKPDNIVVETHKSAEDGSHILDQVQITDIENAVWIKPGKNVLGILAGNDNWRSPEAHLRAKLNKPADMFSFGAVCIYTILGRIVFGRDADFEYHQAQGIEPGLIRLQRQTSYFGDETGYHGLRRHFENDERLCQLLDAMWEDRNAAYIPYKHFSTWADIEDGDFKDIVLRLMSLDPKSRITAKDALEHSYFAAVDAA